MNKQLIILGILAIILAPITILATMIYQLPFPTSISETATIPNQTSPILPLILGGLGLFGITYQSKYNSIGDRLMAFLIGICFVVVALQPCDSVYITQSKVGVFALNPNASNMVHSISALVGFLLLLIWQLFYFTKTHKDKTMTKEKKIRNKIYKTNSVLSIIGIVILVYIYKDNDNLIFYLEAMLLTLAGISCVVKGGLILEDKGE